MIKEEIAEASPSGLRALDALEEANPRMNGSLDDIQPEQATQYDHAAIARARARGVKWKQIAAYYGVSINIVMSAHSWHNKRKAAE